jgi:hypothetical protein
MFIVYGPNPLEYVGTMTWQKKGLTRLRSFLTPVFFAQGGDGSNKLESVVSISMLQVTQRLGASSDTYFIPQTSLLHARPLSLFREIKSNSTVQKK